MAGIVELLEGCIYSHLEQCDMNVKIFPFWVGEAPYTINYILHSPYKSYICKCHTCHVECYSSIRSLILNHVVHDLQSLLFMALRKTYTSQFFVD